MAPVNANNTITILPVRVTDEEIQQGRYRLTYPERLEHSITSDTPPPTSPLSSPPSSSPLKNSSAAPTARSAALPLSSYLNTTASPDTLLLLPWKVFNHDALLTVAAVYTTDEILAEVNRLRTESSSSSSSSSSFSIPLTPITKRQAQQKITSSLNAVAKREGIRRANLRAALQRARSESGCLGRMNGGGKAEEGEEGNAGGEGTVKMEGRVKKVRMVVDRRPARKWERGSMEMRSFTGFWWEARSWERK